VTRTGSGRFRTRLVFPSAGRWTLEARLGTQRLALGAVAVLARAADLDEPFAVAVEADGRVLVADRAGNRVVRIEPATAAKSVVAEAHEPLDVAVGPDGAIDVVSDEQVLRVGPSETTVVAAGFSGATGVSVDNRGNVFVAEYENRIKRVDAATGAVTTIAGNGRPGFAGDGGPATRALVFHPHGLVYAGASVIVADTENDCIRSIEPDGTIKTVAPVETPLHLAAAPNHTLYVATPTKIVRVEVEAGRVSTAAGGGSGGDGGPATRARVDGANHVATAPDGSFYFTEFTARTVRRVDARTGVITTIAR
jgi:streptogramin lyase